jgi:hypothetical protein
MASSHRGDDFTAEGHVLKLLDRCRQFLAVAAILGGLVCAGTAVAQPVISQNTFMESQNKTDCGSVATCSIIFLAVPTNKTLLVRGVNCRIIVGAGGNPTGLRSTTSGEPMFLPVTLQATVGQDRYFIIHETVYQVVANLPTMSVTFQLSAPALIKSMFCTAAGDLL